MNEVDKIDDVVASSQSVSRITSSSYQLSRSHLTGPTTLGWRFWRIAECRTAGFPADFVLSFSEPKLTATADALVATEAQLSFLWAKARDYVSTGKKRIALDLCVPDVGNEKTRLYSQALHHLRKLAKAVHKRRITADLEEYLPAELTASICVADEALSRLRGEYDNEFSTATRASIAAANELSRNERFREAITWQTPRVVKNVLGPLQESTNADSAKTRQFESVVAKYAQRYCTKNDTIGFFGPVGWARICDVPSLVSMVPKEPWLAERTVYFEDWAMEAVAAQLSKDSRLKPWFAPRVLPTVRITRDALILAGEISLPINPAEHAVLSLCDGTHTAEQIAQRLITNPFGGFQTVDEVFSVLERFARDRRIDWSIRIPLFDAFPERYIKKVVEQISDGDIQGPTLRAIAAIDRIRCDVASSTGNPDRLMCAIDRLNSEFHREFGVSEVRRPGETYGGRTLVYEDCLRAIDVNLGANFLHSLGPSIELVLASARWFCSELARTFGHEFNCRYRELLDRKSTKDKGGVDLVSYWYEVQSLFFGDSRLDAEPLQNELCVRWERILGVDAQVEAISVEAEAIKHRVNQEFRARNCGWASACYQSPDIMLALRDGDVSDNIFCCFVLGELHIGTNTLLNQSALNQCPDSQELLANVSQDRGIPRVVFALSKAATRQPVRVRKVLQSDHDIELRVGYDVCATEGIKSMALSDFEVTSLNGDLCVRSYDGSVVFAVQDFFGELMSDYAANLFVMFQRRTYQQRITIGPLVVQRESWRFAFEDIAWYTIADERGRFLEVHKWRRQHRMPQFVFCKLPWEAKPFYVDFASEVYVNLLAKHFRAGAVREDSIGGQIAFSEMMPRHDECWLKDTESNRYTSELRLVAIHSDDLVTLQSPK